MNTKEAKRQRRKRRKEQDVVALLQHKIRWAKRVKEIKDHLAGMTQTPEILPGLKITTLK